MSKLNPVMLPGTEFKFKKRLFIKCKKNSIEVVN